jgi:hypothetical protein
VAAGSIAMPRPVAAAWNPRIRQLLMCTARPFSIRTPFSPLPRPSIVNPCSVISSFGPALMTMAVVGPLVMLPSTPLAMMLIDLVMVTAP